MMPVKKRPCFNGKDRSEFRPYRKADRMIPYGGRVLRRFNLVKNHELEGRPFASFYWRRVRHYLMQGRTVYVWGFAQLYPKIFSPKAVLNSEGMKYIPKPRIVVGMKICLWPLRKARTAAELEAETAARIAKATGNAARGKKIVGRGDLALDMAEHFGIPVKKANQVCIALGYAAAEQLWEIKRYASPMKGFVGFTSFRTVLRPARREEVEMRLFRARTHKTFKKRLADSLNWEKAKGGVVFTRKT